MKLATKLLTPRMVLRKRHGYDWESEQLMPGSIYLEDGDLVETNFLQCKQLDQEGRYVTADLGFFRVTPDMFTVEERVTFDGKSTYFDYRLTDEGWDKLVEQGLPKTEKGYANYKLVTRDVLNENLNNTIVHAAALLKRQERIETLLKQ